MSLLMGELDSIARCAAQYRSERLAALGLKSCHASYLMGICDCPGISQEQLARRIYQNKSSVARQLAVLEEAGFAIRQPGCSACLAMNDDKVPAGKYAVSTSNRNFEGRQGPGARTLLASPLVAAAAAVTGVITDPRELLNEE